MQVKTLVMAVLTAGFVGTTLSMHAEQAKRVTVSASPAMSYAPANLAIRAVVESNEQNRSLEISVESLSFYRSSEIALFGERGPRITMLRLASVPGGYYEVRAIVRGNSGQALAAATATVRVIDQADLP